MSGFKRFKGYSKKCSKLGLRGKFQWKDAAIGWESLLLAVVQLIFSQLLCSVHMVWEIVICFVIIIFSFPLCLGG